MSQTTNQAETSEAAESSPRLAEFQEEVDKLGVTGGKANPERKLLRLGMFLIIAGIVLEIVALILSLNTSSTTSEIPDSFGQAEKIEVGLEQVASGFDSARDQGHALIIALCGLGAILAGGIFYIANSLSRFLRYWLVRLIYEIREND